MAKPQKHPLRTLEDEEVQALQRLAASEQIEQRRWAQALLAVTEGKTFVQAARLAGIGNGDTVSRLARNFNQRGLGVFETAPVRYSAEDRARIVRTAQRLAEQKPSWSLGDLRKALLAEGYSVSSMTLARMVREAGLLRWFGDARALVHQRSDAETQPGEKLKGRGFASQSPERRREIARQGGQQSQASGNAHRWTQKEATAARKEVRQAPRTEKRAAENQSCETK